MNTSVTGLWGDGVLGKGLVWHNGHVAELGALGPASYQ